MTDQTLRAELADAAARRAVIIDRYSMGDKQAECMACRARGAVVLAVLAGVALVFGRRGVGALLGGQR